MRKERLDARVYLSGERLRGWKREPWQHMAVTQDSKGEEGREKEREKWRETQRKGESEREGEGGRDGQRESE